MKHWYQSKTMWANAVALITAVSGYFTGEIDLGTAVSGGVMALLNIILRFVTSQPIE